MSVKVYFVYQSSPIISLSPYTISHDPPNPLLARIQYDPNETGKYMNAIPTIPNIHAAYVIPNVENTLTMESYLRLCGRQYNYVVVTYMTP